MDIMQHAKELNETRQRVWEEAKGFLDDCVRRHPSEAMSAEENAQWDRYNARIDELDAERDKFLDAEKREHESGVAREAFARQYGDTGAARREQNEDEQIRAWFRGVGRRSEDTIDGTGRNALAVNLRAAAAQAEAIRKGADSNELRALLWDTGSAGSLVPTILSQTLYQYLEYTIAAFRMPTTKITTSQGEPLAFPKLGAHAIATQVIAQGTALAGTDPSFLQMTLNSYKYGELVQVASEVIADSAINILDFVARDVGRAVGRKIDVDLITGAGSTNPQGMMTAAVTGAAGTIATGGSLITPTYENLVDCVYGINDAYRQGGSCAWLMNDLTAAKIRKIRSDAGGTTGPVMWVPSVMQGIQPGQPDRLLDFPVYTDPNVASCASNAKIVAFGDWNAYYLREIGDFVFERSDDYAFNVDLSTFRGKWRVDGDYIDLTAVTLLKQSV